MSKTLELLGPDALRDDISQTEKELLESIRGDLIWHDWLLSDWAVAWMSLAWHQGLKGAFADPYLFSEWAPWELCCPNPRPLASPPRAGKKSGRL